MRDLDWTRLWYWLSWLAAIGGVILVALPAYDLVWPPTLYTGAAP